MRAIAAKPPACLDGTENAIILRRPIESSAATLLARELSSAAGPIRGEAEIGPRSLAELHGGWRTTLRPRGIADRASQVQGAWLAQWARRERGGMSGTLLFPGMRSGIGCEATGSMHLNELRFRRSLQRQSPRLARPCVHALDSGSQSRLSFAAC
jgi:hypothetical protein